MATTAHPGLEAILGRPVHEMRIDVPLARLAGRRVLVTGAAGSIGASLTGLLEDCEVLATDIDELDVIDTTEVVYACDRFRPEIVFHLAGAKHAPAGEEDPWSATLVNTLGAKNILDEAARDSCERVVVASTCKACNPETAYGASKLLAERMTLNAGHSVARLYNVVETQGNVFAIWRQIPAEQSIPWTECERYFITLAEAVGLILWSAILPAARYIVDPIAPREMGDVAAAAHPGRDLELVAPRRGDRYKEPLRGSHETMAPTVEHEAIWRVVSPHD